jgi:choline trimethylamine-lyase
MSVPLQRESKLRSRLITTQPTARVEWLRKRYLQLKDKAFIDIVRIKTRIFKETEGEPKAIRAAKAFAATVREMPLNIYPDELFVGWLFMEPRGSAFRWQHAIGLENELDTLGTRKFSPFIMSEADKKELREEIIPYWKKHQYALPFSEIEKIADLPPENPEHQIPNYRWDSLMHWTAGYEKVLQKGLLGVKQEAEERLRRLDLTDPEDVEKLPFIQGAVIALDAASEVGARFAARLREVAGSKKDDQRQAELLQMAENCDRVPAHPPETFYQALQSVWFTHILHGWDNEWSEGMGPGRADQFLYPYFKKDMTDGRITKEAAQELIDCWFMRFSQHFPIHDEIGARWSGTPSPGQHIDVGGLKPDGTDATNELSFMFIEGMMHTPGMVEPTLGLLVHTKTPEDLLIKACQSVALGGGYPMFINHDVMVENLLARYAEFPDAPPVSLETARSGCAIGCHEPTIPNMESGWMPCMLNLGSTLEFVLTNGRRRYDNKLRGIKTGNPRQFATFDELREAFIKQMSQQIRNECIAMNIREMAYQPKVFTSSLVDDCIEKGLAKNEGGARYNIGAIITNGVVDVGNSLVAIKKRVFDEKKITMAQLCDALDNNFEGYAEIRKLCLTAPKFGNDDDMADEQVAWVAHQLTSTAKQYKTRYGGRRTAYQVPQAGYISAGLGVGALPYGRLAGEPLADGISPNQGSDIKGPTAILKSVGKVNNAEFTLGQTLNLKADPQIFEDENGFKRLADLIRVFVDQKADHVQINVVSADYLRAAQKEPEKYRELVVKVAGYNARFVDVHKELQDSIIARTEHGL